MYIVTGPDVIHLGVGSEGVIMNRQTMLKTNKGDFHQTEKNVLLKPKGLLKYIADYRLKFLKKICVSRNNCYKKGIDFKVSLETKACTPFFWSGPQFTFVFYTGAPQSWVDVTITAKSEQKSITSVNCLRYYYVHESIFKTSNLFNKSVPGTIRMDSLLVNLNQSERKSPIQIRIQIVTRSQLLSTKPTTTIHLDWTSAVSLSRDNSKKLIGLPGSLRSVTLEALSSIQNYTINLYWIPDLFSRSSYHSDNERFCHQDVLSKTKYSYCLNYTSLQNSYLFFWHFTQYLQCYVTVPPRLERHGAFLFFMRQDASTWKKRGFAFPKNNKCPKQQSKGKVAKSWTEVSNLCKSIGGTLPLLRNRDELDEIIAFLKLSEDMPPVEGLYVGLKRSFKSQVTMR